nr:hypothetical protein [Brucella intermedia]
MTKLLQEYLSSTSYLKRCEEARGFKHLWAIYCDKGGVTKSMSALLNANKARDNDNLVTALADGDLMNQDLFNVNGSLGEDGLKLKPEQNNPVEGCITFNGADMNKASEVILPLIESVSPDRIILDFPGLGDKNLSHMIGKTFTAEELVEMLKEFGFVLDIAFPIIGKADNTEWKNALRSARRIVDQYGHLDVHFWAHLGKWDGATLNDDADPGFKYWFDDPLRQALMETYGFHEIKVPRIPDLVMPKLANIPVRFSNFFDQEYVKAYNEVATAYNQQNEDEKNKMETIDVRARFAIQKFCKQYDEQINADPYLKEFFGIA